MTDLGRGLYPGYDVLDKRNTPSWNDATRRAIDARLALPRHGRFFTEHEYITVEAIAARIVPQPKNRQPVPVAALVDAKLLAGEMDGYRQPGMPRDGEAWRRGLRALEAEAHRAHGVDFRWLHSSEQDALLRRMEKGDMQDEAWGGMPPATFFKQRLAKDVVRAYYAHPTAWSEIGFGGPASPRGYVRLGPAERDPWEAAEAKPGGEAAAYRKNRHVR